MDADVALYDLFVDDVGDDSVPTCLFTFQHLLRLEFQH
jgi:hypothetical protein